MTNIQDKSQENISVTCMDQRIFVFVCLFRTLFLLAQLCLSLHCTQHDTIVDVYRRMSQEKHETKLLGEEMEVASPKSA